MAINASTMHTVPATIAARVRFFSRRVCSGGSPVRPPARATARSAAERSRILSDKRCASDSTARLTTGSPGLQLGFLRNSSISASMAAALG